ncbi:hypothetical protein Back11_25880 [Paenibacillus baekrokdamisoli]|uniref:Uncharacterized protein n=1 Tax=Paenibacillus baekrokdamisoli TaxID=1712516 RepID=A0A3G9J8Q4_9BACL|nr:extracellular solute-binding protein [Paenibacillus baekrokdamisoli]MBB3070238.1 ABC-type glycerol-3-phosphate transport system substrate-binding protein [Paenibacillus baekrokdamisoli]BBH21243.1 hypothetical protein Back11_25880 [Paenibacillus baekrokdamisoli]
MSRRKYMMLLLGVFALCAALLVPILGKPVLTVIPFDGTPSTQQPQVGVDGSETIASTLHIAVSMTDAEFQYWQLRNESYALNHPNVKIIMTNFTESEAAVTWKEAFQIGDPFDIMLMDNNRVREFAVHGYLFPADSIFTGDSLGDQLEALTEPLKWNGSLWGVPLDCNPLLVVWQRELLKSASLNAPPKDWNAFLTALNLLQTSSPEVKSFNFSSSNPSQYVAWLGAFKDTKEKAANLAPFIDSMKQQLRFTIDHASTMSYLDPSQQTSELMQAFEAKSLLSSVMPWSAYQSITDQQRELLTVADQTAPIVWSGGRSFVLSSRSEELEAARLWINEMTSSSQQIEHYQLFNRLPAKISVYANEFALKGISERPPHWLIGMLKQDEVTPDPYWSEHWDKWVKVWSSFDWSSSTIEQMNTIIRTWNGEQKSDATKAPQSEGDGKLNH